MSNYISKDINPERFKEILDSIKAIKNKMPYLNEIEAASQLLLPKLLEKQVPFAEKCLAHAQNVPLIVPVYIDIEEFNKALTLYNELLKIQSSLVSLLDLVNGTIATSGSDAYVASVSIYKNVAKQANNETIPQIHSILVDLNKIFDTLGDSKPLHI